MKLQTIGHLRTPYRTLAECPSSPAEVTARTRIELLWKYLPALEEIEAASHLIVLYWLDAANRAVLRIATRVDGKVRGVFANRSPMRPNPIAIATVKLFELEAHTIVVSGLDCLDGTPLLDLKPYIPALDCVPDARVEWMK